MGCGTASLLLLGILFGFSEIGRGEVGQLQRHHRRDSGGRRERRIGGWSLLVMRINVNGFNTEGTEVMRSIRRLCAHASHREFR
jgi:hypothetical protein